MNRRVRSAAAVFLALFLVLSIPTTASAAVMQRDHGLYPAFMQRIIRTIRKVLKPLAPAIEEDEAKPYPPIP